MKKILICAAFMIAGATFSLGASTAATWATNCASCHGKDGSGNSAMGRKLGTKNYHDPEVQAAFNDAEIESAIKNGVKTNGRETMPPFGTKLSAADIKALVSYVRAFKR